MSDTPETGAKIYERRTICRVGGIQEVVELVDADIARELERERDQSRSQRDAWKAIALREASKLGVVVLEGAK